MFRPFFRDYANVKSLNLAAWAWWACFCNSVDCVSWKPIEILWTYVWYVLSSANDINASDDVHVAARVHMGRFCLGFIHFRPSQSTLRTAPGDSTSISKSIKLSGVSKSICGNEHGESTFDKTVPSDLFGLQYGAVSMNRIRSRILLLDFWTGVFEAIRNTNDELMGGFYGSLFWTFHIKEVQSTLDYEEGNIAVTVELLLNGVVHSANVVAHWRVAEHTSWILSAPTAQHQNCRNTAWGKPAFWSWKASTGW